MSWWKTYQFEHRSNLFFSFFVRWTRELSTAEHRPTLEKGVDGAKQTQNILYLLKVFGEICSDCIRSMREKILGKCDLGKHSSHSACIKAYHEHTSHPHTLGTHSSTTCSGYEREVHFMPIKFSLLFFDYTSNMNIHRIMSKLILPNFSNKHQMRCDGASKS